MLLLVVPLASGLKPVNLLWLMSDSFDGRFFDPEAPQWAQVELPHLRELAKQSTNYVRAYANNPQCVPSRSSMMMGRHTHHIGAWSNSMGIARRLDAAFAPPADFCDRAYNVTDCLSMQHELHQDEPSDLDRGCMHDWNATVCRKMADEWQTNVTNGTPDVLRALRRAGVDVHVFGKVDIGFGFLEQFPNATADGFHRGGSMPIQTRSADIDGPTKPDPRSITDTTVDSVHPEDWQMVDRCIQWLHRHDASSTGWLLHCSINIPHPPFQTNATWLAAVNESAIGVPRSFTNVSRMHAADHYMTVSKHVSGDFTADEIKRTRRVYAAMCYETDHLLGRVLRAAEQTGHLGARTYVLFLSDHGEMAMEHRQVWKNSMYEGASRVPILLSGPGVPVGGKEDHLVQLLDVYPTLLDMFGLPRATAGTTLDGTSLLETQALRKRKFVVSQYHSNMGNTGTFMLRSSDGYKYIAYGTTRRGLERAAEYPPQLFHVESDADEIRDLAPGGEHGDVMRALDAQLHSVVDIAATDALAKAVDHWLFQQWFVLRSEEQIQEADGLQKLWRKAYGNNFTKEAWAAEWDKAQEWMAL